MGAVLFLSFVEPFIFRVLLCLESVSRTASVRSLPSEGADSSPPTSAQSFLLSTAQKSLAQALSGARFLQRACQSFSDPICICAGPDKGAKSDKKNKKKEKSSKKGLYSCDVGMGGCLRLGVSELLSCIRADRRPVIGFRWRELDCGERGCWGGQTAPLPVAQQRPGEVHRPDEDRGLELPAIGIYFVWPDEVCGGQ